MKPLLLVLFVIATTVATFAQPMRPDGPAEAQRYEWQRKRIESIVEDYFITEGCGIRTGQVASTIYRQIAWQQSFNPAELSRDWQDFIVGTADAKAQSLVRERALTNHRLPRIAQLDPIVQLCSDLSDIGITTVPLGALALLDEGAISEDEPILLREWAALFSGDERFFARTERLIKDNGGNYILYLSLLANVPKNYINKAQQHADQLGAFTDGEGGAVHDDTLVTLDLRKRLQRLGRPRDYESIAPLF